MRERQPELLIHGAPLWIVENVHQPLCGLLLELLAVLLEIVVVLDVWLQKRLQEALAGSSSLVQNRDLVDGLRCGFFFGAVKQALEGKETLTFWR